MDFSKFDKQVDLEQLTKDFEEAKNNAQEYDEVPNGAYICKIEKMEIKPTNTDGAPMFSVMLRIMEGKHKKQCLFFNRKIYGNKESDKWNDGKAIATVTGWLNKLETETVPVFKSYTQFNELVLDIFEECQEYNLRVEVEYDSKAFNPISIEAVWEE